MGLRKPSWSAVGAFSRLTGRTGRNKLSNKPAHVGPIKVAANSLERALYTRMSSFIMKKTYTQQLGGAPTPRTPLMSAEIAAGRSKRVQKLLHNGSYFRILFLGSRNLVIK